MQNKYDFMWFSYVNVRIVELHFFFMQMINPRWHLVADKQKISFSYYIVYKYAQNASEKCRAHEITFLKQNWKFDFIE